MATSIKIPFSLEGADANTPVTTAENIVDTDSGQTQAAINAAVSGSTKSYTDGTVFTASDSYRVTAGNIPTCAIGGELELQETGVELSAAVSVKAKETVILKRGTAHTGLHAILELVYEEDEESGELVATKAKMLARTYNPENLAYTPASDKKVCFVCTADDQSFSYTIESTCMSELASISQELGNLKGIFSGISAQDITDELNAETEV